MTDLSIDDLDSIIAEAKTSMEQYLALCLRALLKAQSAAMLNDGNSPVIPDGWIKCSERMPEKGTRVFIFIEFESRNIPPLIKDAEFSGTTFRVGQNTVNITGCPRVTHWMQLPAAPSQESRHV